MTCVQSTSGYITTTGSGLPTATGNWQWGIWVKITSFASDFTQVLAWNDGSADFYGVDTDEPDAATNPNAITGYIFSSSLDSDILVSGTPSPYTGWLFLSGSHATGTADYRIRGRKEGESTLTIDVTITSPTGELTPSTFYLLTDGFGSPVSTRIRSFWTKSSILNDADTLTASSSLSAPSGTNLTFLALNDHTVANDNLGTGADWTINGTLTTEADEPNPSTGGGGGY
jgi:hypothetical protein